MQVQKKIDELLALRASEWLEILPEASDEQLRAFDTWLSQSKLHIQEFLEVAEVEFCLRGLDAGRTRDVEEVLRRLAPGVRALRNRAAPAPSTARLHGRRWKGAGVAAAATIALVALLVQRPGAAKEYVTEVGEQRTVELADSSVVTLNADSRIAVRLQDAARQIELLRGEAIFKVAHDPARPFRVHTRVGTVQAVGTQFNVHSRLNGDARVSVLDGRVRITTGAGAQSSALTLGAGEEADVRRDGSIERRENATVANAIAWSGRRLVFDNASLEEMVTEFNRHNRSRRLRLEDIKDSARRYDGTFDATDPQALADMLARETDLLVEKRGNEIVIRGRR